MLSTSTSWKIQLLKRQRLPAGASGYAPKGGAAQAQKSHTHPPSCEQEEKGPWHPSKGHMLPGPHGSPLVSLDFLQCQQEGAAFSFRSPGPPSEAGCGALLPLNSAP